MKLNENQLCIYIKDIALITGKSYRQAWRIHNKIKNHYKKSPEQFLSIAEFCEYTGIPETLVRKGIGF